MTQVFEASPKVVTRSPFQGVLQMSLSMTLSFTLVLSFPFCFYCLFCTMGNLKIVQTVQVTGAKRNYMIICVFKTHSQITLDVVRFNSRQRQAFQNVKKFGLLLNSPLEMSLLLSLQ